MTSRRLHCAQVPHGETTSTGEETSFVLNCVLRYPVQTGNILIYFIFSGNLTIMILMCRPIYVHLYCIVKVLNTVCMVFYDVNQSKVLLH